jgi:hypothetical protein
MRRGTRRAPGESFLIRIELRLRQREQIQNERSAHGELAGLRARQRLTAYLSWLTPSNASPALILEDRATGDFFLAACQI